MRKLYLVLLAITLSVAMLVISVIPVIAAKAANPNDNQPVAWASSEFNIGNLDLPFAGGKHLRHSLKAILLGDGSVVGHYNYGVGQAHGEGCDLVVLNYPIGMFPDLNDTPLWGYYIPNLYSNFWYDEIIGAAMADIKVCTWIDNDPAVPEGYPLIIRYQFADYGEPGTSDWQRVWYFDWFGWYWEPMYGTDYCIPYYYGNAKVQLPKGNIDVTLPPGDWDPFNLPDPPPME